MTSTVTGTRVASLEERVDALAWDELREQLDSRGFAVTSPLLLDSESDDLSDLFDGGRFRSTIEMARHRFGDGRYRYFDHPLPAAISELRGSFYRHLAPIANDWSGLLGGAGNAFGLEHDEPGPLCSGRAGAPDAADPPLRRGRLECAAPGPLRRRPLPLPGRHGPV